MKKLGILFAVILLSVPSRAHGALGTFTPHVYSTEGDIIIDAHYQSQTNEASGRSTGWTNSYLSERFVLTTTGWVYHPRFMVFLAKLGAGAAHERVTNDFRSNEPTGTQSTFLGEYEFRAVFLPEHDYNLEVYTLRTNPYIPGTVSIGFDTINYDSGAIFEYKRRPWAFKLAYDYSRIESETYTTDTNSFRTNAVYFKDWGTFSGSYSREESDNSYREVSTNLTTDQYSGENQLRFFENKVYITSNVSKIIFKQNSTVGDIDDDRFTWNEKLNIELPLNFNVNFYYNRFDETTKSDSPGVVGKVTLDSTSDIWGVLVMHKLYQSLVTSYNFTKQKSDTTTGNTDTTVNTLTLAYNKRIPHGQLITGLLYSKSSVDRQGIQTVLNERSQTTYPGEYTLQLTDIDESTISIQVLSPFTGSWINLEKNLNYLITTIGNTIRIQIIFLPAAVQSPDPFYLYTFQTTYELLQENATIDTTTYGGNVKLELFNNSVTPYFSYYHTEQSTQSSGAFSVTPLDTTTYIVGLLLQKDPYSLLLEYQDYQSNVNPYTLMKTQFNYRKNLSTTTRLTFEGLYQHTAHGESNSQGSNVDENFYGATLWLQKRYPKNNMILSLGSTYNRATGINTRQSYSVNGELFWKLKKFELRAGIGIGGTKTDYDTGSQKSLYQSYTLTVRRQIF